MIQEGEESYTTNLWQQRYNKILLAGGDEPLTTWQWYEVVEKKEHRGRLWRMLEKDQYIREMWEYYSCERSKVKKFREDAEKGKQEGHKANGSANRWPSKPWNKRSAVKTLIAPPG